MDRRTFLWATGCAAAATAAAPRTLADPRKIQAMRFGPGFHDAIVATEKASGGRLGVAVIDTGTGERFGYRSGERFPMCSTFKFVLAAAMLKRVEAREETLDRRLPVAKGDIVSNSPFSTERVGGTASIAELCRTTIVTSDNTAANLLLRTIGGPEGFTRRLRAFGDSVTQLDRWETMMSEATPGDVRDTTSPDAMADMARRLVLGNALAPASRAQLTEWMKATRTGLKGLRAGLPDGWQVADKTGAGGFGTDNHVAVLWPPRGAPLVVASYITGSSLPSGETRPLHAPVARALAAAVG